MPATGPKIVSRPGWGANPLVTPAGLISTPTEELWLHHTAGEQFDEAGMRMLQAFTLHRPDEHYVDLEYTFVVDHADCRIFESRGLGRNTAATGGRVRRFGLPIGPTHNSISHAICVMGNFQVDEPSDELVRTLANLVAWGYEHSWWRYCAFTGGHRDASGNSTACPGNKLEAAIPRINALALEIHRGTAYPPAPKVRAQYMPAIQLPPIVSSMVALDANSHACGSWSLGADGGVFGLPLGISIHGSPHADGIPLEAGVTWSRIRPPAPGDPGPRLGGRGHYTIEKSNGARFGY